MKTAQGMCFALAPGATCVLVVNYVVTQADVDSRRRHPDMTITGPIQDQTRRMTVSDDLTGDSTACATLAPGATCVLVVNYVVTQADVDAGQITN